MLFLLSALLAGKAVAENILPQVAWTTSCTGADFCGQLEFCESGSAFGFRLPGTSACNYPGPTIRMQPGSTYKLTLANKGSEETNLHTHGLHVSGSGDADDVTRHVSPGMCLSYVYDIKSDHVGGTYWYHAHHHGRTDPQVSGGAFGVVIIEDGQVAPNSDVASWMNNDHLLQVSTVSGTEGNGVSGGDVFDFVRNQWYRLRVSVVQTSAKNTDVVFSNGCEVRRVSNDGIWRSQVPGPSDSSFPINGVGRSDFAVKCTANAGNSVTVRLGRKTAATLNIVSGSVSSATPFNNGQAWTPARPAHLQNLASASVPNSNKYALSMSASSLGGYSWDPNNGIPGTFAWNEVHEWSIGGSGAHPFHLHLYHMQIMSDCGDHEVGEFYDTISASGTCVVRFKTADIGERCVLHCHVLGHEDNGAMTWIDVQGSGMPVNTGFAGQEQCGSAPPTCTATACFADQECGSKEGTDDCGDACTLNTAPTCDSGFTCMTSTWTCEPDSCTPTTCTPTFECGSSSGTDDCGDFCVAASGSCSNGEECATNICEAVQETTAPPAPQCANENDSCQFNPCCPGLTCPGGKPNKRKCAP